SRLAEGLRSLGFDVVTPDERMAAIVSFRAKDSHRIAEELYRRGIVVSARPGLVRVSPHFYNIVEEVEKLLDALRGVAGGAQAS
ncbi:MAG: aminotransferase class V-fold PLP-dependent enzyme, partial [Desulfurococcales archaeon]|nr:aminotransferase class V-fold PLP-dependent enzyme [Desulfurococcales archaeon]